jgi:hypothetical protein
MKWLFINAHTRMQRVPGSQVQIQKCSRYVIDHLINFERLHNILLNIFRYENVTKDKRLNTNYPILLNLPNHVRKYYYTYAPS